MHFPMLSLPSKSYFIHKTHFTFQETVQVHKRKYLDQSGLEESFEGIKLEDIVCFEDCFEINVNIFHLSGNSIAKSFFKSMHRYDDTMNLNMFENHLSYIKNKKAYSQKHVCQNCDKLFKTNRNLIRHQTSCEKDN